MSDNQRKTFINNNMEEYEDAELYDLENDFHEDLDFLKEWAHQQGGPVVEIGCGTGRITIPLAQADFELIGVDLSEKMLERAKQKESDAADIGMPIRWELQDATKLDLGVQSPFVFMTGHTFQHLLTNHEQDAFLQAVASHLTQGGIFIFNSRFPSKEELMQPETEEYWRSYTDTLGRRVEVSTIASYDMLTQLQHYTTIRRVAAAQEEQVGLSDSDPAVKDKGEIGQENRTRITLRYVYPQEMARLLDQHGFEILHVYDSWNKKPLSATCYSMVYVCRKRT